MSEIRFRIFVSFIFIFGIVSFSFGQTINGNISGTILDQQGAVIPGAMVTATNTETGFKRSVTASDNGSFRVTGVPVGNYSVRAEKEGFAAKINDNVQVSVGTD